MNKGQLLKHSGPHYEYIEQVISIGKDKVKIVCLARKLKKISPNSFVYSPIKPDLIRKRELLSNPRYIYELIDRSELALCLYWETGIKFEEALKSQNHLRK